MKVMSLNLWNMPAFKKSKNHYKKRAYVITKIIKNNNVDIVFTQEMSSKMKKTLMELLLNYNFIYSPRKNGKNEEANCIIVKKNIKVNFSKLFSLSNSPDKPNTKFLFDFFPRTLNYVNITFNGKKYFLFNTHLDHVFYFSRKQELKVILTIIKKITNKGCKIILAGDFNMKYNKFLEAISTDLNIKNYSKNLGNTYRCFYRKGAIDHVFLSNNLTVKKVYKYTKNVKGIYPSDHYPIIIDIL